VDAAAEFLLRWHYLGLFLVLLVEEGGVPLPVPGDLFIAAMGFLAWQGRASLAPTVAVVTAATVLGAGFLYAVSGRLGRPLILKLARRLGYDEAREARVEAWVERLGPGAIVIGRLVPGLRIVMTVAAGALRVDPRVFTVGTALAGVVWALLYFGIGWAVGHGWGRLSAARLGAWPLLAALVVAAVAALVGWRVRARRAPR
jgi:membrane protein DedA with SNARE-associated domain